MIRNVKLKHFLVDNVFPIFSWINKFIAKDDKVIFIYCANGELNDNSEALFHYLLDKGYDSEYEIVCGVGNVKRYSEYESDNVKFIPKAKCISQYMKSGHVFYSMGKMPIKPARNQCVINMWHGIPLKTIGKLSNLNNGEEFFFDYVCASSELYVPIMAKAFGCPHENVVICGEPKTDKLFIKKKRSSQKLIVWTPTFRQSSFLGYSDSSNENVLPLFENSEWSSLNDMLSLNNVTMVVKLHPLQDLHGFNMLEKSNLQIYSDSAFRSKGMNLYELLSQSDGLIADYSSVYLEYLVLDRPICFAMDDMEQYAENRGFVFENPLDYMPGEHICEKEQLVQFVEKIHDGIDEYKEKRHIVNQQVNHYKDGQNCKRVLEISGVAIEGE